MLQFSLLFSITILFIYSGSKDDVFKLQVLYSDLLGLFASLLLLLSDVFDQTKWCSVSALKVCGFVA